MHHNTEVLYFIQQIVKLYENRLKEVGKRHALTHLETDIVAFLHNNPGKDTASDIVNLRRLQKGNVSLAVESLLQKGLLQRYHDQQDRRRIHLFLTPAAQPILAEITAMRAQLQQGLFAGFTPSEQALYEAFTSRIMANTLTLFGSEALSHADR